MSTLEIEARDVIKIVLQFCKENSLHQTFQTLQNECQVSLNTMDSVETFVADIISGRWDAILPQFSQLKLPRINWKIYMSRLIMTQQKRSVVC
ncbi:suppressor of mec-8 and unc-52 protein homolog 1-like isoform X3 [Gastrolobium bilobum]|uniref:suppressor of mec-8 and unc-52 protein homolog 1-like isoform X3 n=1 Tax=Gastrolobium bilobum TaxID=150636 RepID=UPI002AAF9978|nr:suppressor of mec-8 and unc-52 protein homolog 1-like isoform X3 [Gastrolobium bilobum]